jgi:hypothetical protein
MSRAIRAGSLVVAMLLVPRLMRAQAGAPAPDSATIVKRRATLTTDLRNFAAAQETFFKEYGHFARSVHDLVELKKLEPSQGTTIVLLTSSDIGYSAIAIHSEVPELVCAFWLGKAPPPLGTSEEGRVICRVPAGGPRVP